MPYSEARGELIYKVSAPSETNHEAKVESNEPEANCRQRLIRVSGGYSATPTGGLLTITDGTTTLTIPVAAAGPFELEPQFVGKAAAKITVTLAAGGSVHGYVNAQFTYD